MTTIFLKKSVATINGKTYCNYKIVESYRTGGKVKHRILFTLGNLSDEQAERLRLAISAYSNPDVIVSKTDDIVVTKHTAYLEVMVMHHLFENWNFDDFFKEDYWVEAMVINRAVSPVSKINVSDWLSKTVLPACLDLDPASTDPFEIYRSLDRLAKREGELQGWLYRQLRQRYPDDKDAFFYDLTSTYFEGGRCVLATLGYSRDHRPDCEQIVIALMITSSGYPFYWRVLPGNTQDVTTIDGLVREARERFGIEKCTVVFDRGLVSAGNLAILEGCEWSYISCLDRDEMAGLEFFQSDFPRAVTFQDYGEVITRQGFEPYDANRLLYLKEHRSEDRRYILSFDPGRFLKERRLQMQKLDQARKWIDEKNQVLSQAKKARNLDALKRELQGMLCRKKAKKFLKVEIAPDTRTVTKKGVQRNVETFRLSSTVDEAALDKEQRLHGVSCFITNLPQEQFPAREVISWYRRKNKVEEAFHEIKSHLDLRPVFLTRAERVRAHVTICILAYFLYNDMELRLKKHLPEISCEDALGILKECRINRISLGPSKTKLGITQVAPSQKEVLDALDAGGVVEPKLVKRLLKKAENWL